MYELTVESNFSSAHNLRGYEGACENLHGHNWRVEACLEAAGLDGSGMVMDFKRFKAELKRIADRLDHKYLNEVPPFDKENTTAENLARYFFTELSNALNNKDREIRVSKVRVWESDTAAASYHEDA